MGVELPGAAPSVMTSEAAGSSPATPTMQTKTAPGPSTAGRPPRLFGVTRADLPAGLRAAQVGHALIAWTVRYGPPPENLVLLEVPDEQALLGVLARCVDCDAAAFHEPDLNGEFTAFAVGPRAARALSNLPLLLRAA